MEPLVISLGGSVLVNDEPDTGFLREFQRLILRQATKRKVFICVGGGSTARRYQKALEGFGSGPDARDWIGIHATRLNAHLLRLSFGKDADQKLVEHPKYPHATRKKIVIAAGWKPGWSTDYDAVLLAQAVGSSTVVNLTNVDCVYDKDPRRYKDAKPLSQLSWANYKKIIGGRWAPGLHTPFDPIAAREAEKAKIRVVIMDGNDQKNFGNFLEGRKFNGTVLG